MNIFYPKTQMNTDEITLYTFLNFLVHTPPSLQSVVSVKQLAYLMHGEKYTRHHISSIKATLESLGSEGVIFYTQVDSELYIIDDKSFYVKDRFEYFTIVDYDIAAKLINTPKLLAYYVVLRGTYSNANNIGSQSVKYIMDLTGLSNKTIISYNKKLEDMKVVHTYHSKFSDSRNTNVYGDYCNYEKIDAFGMQRDSLNKVYDNSVANWMRSVTQRYNRFVKDGGNYSAELYADCIKFNEICKQRQEFQPGHEYLDKMKDLSVFRVDKIGN